jgi:SET domain-containing protein
MKPLPAKYRNVQRQLCVKRSSAGLGLFTEAPIEKGGFVIEYMGPIVGPKDIEGKKNKYLFLTNSRRFVDGSPRWNLARYMNHACAPNCEMVVSKGRIYAFSRRKIKAGEELTYNYGTEYFDEHIGPHGCRCRKCQ